MTEGLAFDGADLGRGPDARVLGTVADIDGLRLAVGTERGHVVIGDPDDILGLSWPLDAAAAGELAKLIVWASSEAGRQ